MDIIAVLVSVLIRIYGLILAVNFVSCSWTGEILSILEIAFHIHSPESCITKQSF